MSRLAPALIALTLSLSACAADRAAVSAYNPERLKDYDAAIEREAQAANALQDAVASVDPDDDQPARQDLDDARNAVAEIEGDTIRKQGAPLAATLPYGLGALGLEAAVALFSSRKRKLYTSAVKNLGTGQLAAAAGNILQAYGAAHSTPQPQPVVVSQSGTANG